MRLHIGGYDVTQLTASITITGDIKACARTLDAEIVQSPVDGNIPSIKIETGAQVTFEADGQDFYGIVFGVDRSTDASTIDIKAYDLGIYLRRNKITYKAKRQTPEGAAKAICAMLGVETGNIEITRHSFSRNYKDTTAYDAIMTGYTLASKATGEQYVMRMRGTKLCVDRKGAYVATVLTPRSNLISATYSEAADENEEGGELTRKATVQCKGNALCVTGNAVMVKETYTGLYGLFFIDGDTHQWTNNIYTCKLELNWKNTMDEKEAGAVIGKSKAKAAVSGDFVAVDPWGNPYDW